MPRSQPPHPPPSKGGAARTCDGHVADTLLVHGWHQYHGLGLHHHRSWQWLEDTKTIMGSEKHTPHKTSAHLSHRKRPGRDSTGCSPDRERQSAGRPSSLNNLPH